VAGTPQPPPEVAAYYDAFAEEDRLARVVVAAAISRSASALAGLVRKLTLDPRFVEIRDRDLATGEHRNDTGRIEYFTTAYFHRPEELRAEFERAGFGDIQVLGVEGLGEWLTDFDERWADPALRYDVLDVARRLAAGPTRAYAVAKSLLNQAAGVDQLDYHLDEELQHLARIADSPDFAEGLRAFFAKDAAAFQGR